MNKALLSHLFLLLFLLLCAGAHSQDTYYYYKGEKLNLTLDRAKLHITATADFRKTAPAEFTPTDSLRMKGRAASGVLSGNIRFESVPNEAEYHRKVRALKRNKEVITLQPCFLTSDSASIEMSSYFYVKLKAAADSTVLRQLARQKKVAIVEQNRFMPLWYTLQCTEETSDDALVTANSFYESGRFAAAAPDFSSARLHGTSRSGERSLSRPDTPTSKTAEALSATEYCNDPSFPYQWGLHNTAYSGIDINACATWEMTQGEGIKVAVFDSGIDLEHEDLRANISPLSYDAESGSSPSRISPEYNSHGTHCAGIIGAVKDNGIQVAGVAPKCTLMSVSYRFFFDTSAEPVKIADGINWAWKNGADVINNSWGCETPSELIDEAIDSALVRGRSGKGTVVVFSVGNEGRKEISYPANSNPDILTVGSISKNGYSSDISNYGPSLDLIAPGDSILSTLTYSSAPGYKKGTSMAAPHVAGVAALVLSRNPDLTGQEVRDILEKNAQKVKPLSYPYQTTPGRPNGKWNEIMGYGLVNAYYAVQAACNTVDFIEQSVTTDTTIKGCEIYTRNIEIEPNAKLTLEAREGISIPGAFEVKKGGELEITIKNE